MTTYNSDNSRILNAYGRQMINEANQLAKFGRHFISESCERGRRGCRRRISEATYPQLVPQITQMAAEHVAEANEWIKANPGKGGIYAAANPGSVNAFKKALRSLFQQNGIKANKIPAYSKSAELIYKKQFANIGGNGSAQIVMGELKTNESERPHRFTHPFSYASDDDFGDESVPRDGFQKKVMYIASSPDFEDYIANIEFEGDRVIVEFDTEFHDDFEDAMSDFDNRVSKIEGDGWELGHTDREFGTIEYVKR